MKTTWDRVAQHFNKAFDTKIVLMEAENPLTIDDPCFKIVAFRRPQGQLFNPAAREAEEAVEAGSLLLTVKETVILLERGLEKVDQDALDDTIDRVSYSVKHHQWDMILRDYCTVQSTGAIFIDELTFYANRFGFDIS